MSEHKGEERRQPIPAELRRRVLVEAGHRCAIPTCRYIEVEIHHIIPWANCKAHEYENLIALCPNCHNRADRGEIDRKALRLYKANLRFAHDKFSQLELDVLFDLYRIDENQTAMWPPAMQVLLRRILEAGYITAAFDERMFARIGGMRTDPLHLRLTDRGRAFIEEMGLHEL